MSVSDSEITREILPKSPSNEVKMMSTTKQTIFVLASESPINLALAERVQSRNVNCGVFKIQLRSRQTRFAAVYESRAIWDF